jgi:hypothetical protein
VWCGDDDDASCDETTWCGVVGWLSKIGLAVVGVAHPCEVNSI